MIPAILHQCTSPTFATANQSQSNWFKEAVVLAEVRITYVSTLTNAGQTTLPVSLSPYLTPPMNTPLVLEMRASMLEILFGRNVYVIILGLSLL